MLCRYSLILFGISLFWQCLICESMFCSGVMVMCILLRLCLSLYSCIMVWCLQWLVKMFFFSSFSVLWQCWVIGRQLLIMKFSIVYRQYEGFIWCSSFGLCFICVCGVVQDSDVLWCIVIRKCGLRKVWVLLYLMCLLIICVVVIIMNSELLYVFIFGCWCVLCVFLMVSECRQNFFCSFSSMWLLGLYRFIQMKLLLFLIMLLIVFRLMLWCLFWLLQCMQLMMQVGLVIGMVCMVGIVCQWVVMGKLWWFSVQVRVMWIGSSSMIYCRLYCVCRVSQCRIRFSLDSRVIVYSMVWKLCYGWWLCSRLMVLGSSSRYSGESCSRLWLVYVVWWVLKFYRQVSSVLVMLQNSQNGSVMLFSQCCCVCSVIMFVVVISLYSSQGYQWCVDLVGFGVIWCGSSICLVCISG